MIYRLAILSARDADPLEHPACMVRGRSPEMLLEGQRLVHVVPGDLRLPVPSLTHDVQHLSSLLLGANNQSLRSHGAASLLMCQ